ncbi:hypothetical protein LX64_02683 [Chitinophaga skermanii]|uniref:Uncharacterized protein n=1 Tax=Chitinophaga skermanii TaxID=331697 RepID=A0A327QQ97_9BACT|nr:hypothetical protein [Chitinophaga skermanii]RAJ05523.1 hypothetical protein LX64_02683 [Chitinophaga skermanii]
MGKVIPLYSKHLEQVSFYKTTNGFIATTPNKKVNKWAGEQYDAIRAHRKEFGKAAQVAADIRVAFADIMAHIPSPSMYRRLSSRLLQVLKSDITNIRGERTVEEGDVLMMKGFEFNQSTAFNRACRARYDVMIDRVSGEGKVTIPAFKPTQKLHAPKSATHCKLVATLHAINFDSNDVDSIPLSTDALPLNKHQFEDITFNFNFTPNDPRHLFVSVGIVFIEMINNREYKIMAGKFNAMAVVAVFPKPVATAIVTTIAKEKPQITKHPIAQPAQRKIRTPRMIKRARYLQQAYHPLE